MQKGGSQEPPFSVSTIVSSGLCPENLVLAEFRKSQRSPDPDPRHKAEDDGVCSFVSAPPRQRGVDHFDRRILAVERGE